MKELAHGDRVLITGGPFAGLHASVNGPATVPGFSVNVDNGGTSVVVGSGNLMPLEQRAQELLAEGPEEVTMDVRFLLRAVVRADRKELLEAIQKGETMEYLGACEPIDDRDEVVGVLVLDANGNHLFAEGMVLPEIKPIS